jgi:transposase InsO family protein
VTWAADITYIWTDEGWLYLAIVLDRFSRRVIGWSMQPMLERSLVLEALEMALHGRRPAAGLVHHRDRGSQYASQGYQALLAREGSMPSMRRTGNCWDTAPVERFFATLKKELVHHCRYHTRAAARTALFEYIEVWYNRQRRHSTLAYMTPVAYENRVSVVQAA